MNTSQPDISAQTYQMPPMSSPQQPLMQQQPNYQQQHPQYNQYGQPQYGQPNPYGQPMPYGNQGIPLQQIYPAPALTTTTVISVGGGGICATKPTFRTNQNIYCGNCRCNTISSIEFMPGAGTWIVCLALGCLVGVFAFIALCIDDCKDCNHYCSRCGAFLGSVNFLLD